MKSILGISAFYHDSAACLLKNGKIIAAAQEERFTRKKHDSSYPKNAVQFVLNYADLKLSEVDQIVFFEKPFLKFERLLETYVAFAPKEDPKIVIATVIENVGSGSKFAAPISNKIINFYLDNKLEKY